ncbi:restriction endonuclease subunit S [Bacillus cereus group sp. Bce025]|nr:restriction endonuclease subunit S [Bacillus cereus]MDA2497222.1 restriction endonuclease subunit S [Bacillus cereus]MRC31857.1 restriction endonuclease subunit S [Bacillus thuringiensis]
MITNYKSYPAYKDSKVSWIGKIPSDWEISKLKFQTNINKNTLAENTDPFYEIQYVDIGNVDSNGEIGELQKYCFEQAPSRARRIVKNGDTLVSTVRTYLKAITSVKEAPNNLICSTGFAVLTPKNGMDSLYLSYLVRSDIYIDEIVSRSVGVSYPAINASEIGELECILPDLKTQEKIGGFLEKKTNDIKLLINGKQKLIELLEERRQVMITEAVTKGLNPNVKMKDSDVKWIGEIPEHWKKTRLDFIARVKARLGWKGLKAEEYVNEGYIFLATPNLKGRNIDFKNVNYITEERYLESPEIMLEKGDVLLAKDGSTLGITNVVRELPSKATVNSSIAVLRPKELIDSIYFYYYLSSTYIQDIINQIKDGMGVPHLFQADIKKFPITLPPLFEQKEIAKHIDGQVQNIDSLIETIKVQIQQLKDYRQSLIYEAVTGKIDVRDFKVES